MSWSTIALFNALLSEKTELYYMGTEYKKGSSVKLNSIVAFLLKCLIMDPTYSTTNPQHTQNNKQKQQEKTASIKINNFL